VPRGGPEGPVAAALHFGHDRAAEGRAAPAPRRTRRCPRPRRAGPARPQRAHAWRHAALPHDGVSAAGSAEAYKTDAGSVREAAALVALLAARHPRLDVAVTTPGLNILRQYSITRRRSRSACRAQYKGIFHFFHAFIAIMVKPRIGSIVACSSVRAETIEPGLAVYGSLQCCPRRGSTVVRFFDDRFC
jgi:NADP-dependent 3-hydroxy acid dehydrogenase YdfG